MAYNTKLGLAAANAEAAAIGALCNGGTICLYTGTQPATADTAVTDQTKLATLTFAGTAVASTTDGVATFNAITKDSSADANGTPTWFRAWQSNGTTAVFDGTVGLSGTDCVIDAIPITQGAEVSAVSMVYTANRG
jgi:hypothetical protein